MMGSPRGEPERRPGEDQVAVTLTKGFWMGKFEATQGEWKRAMGKLPGPLTAELPDGDDFPVGNVNFAETEAFCRKLTEYLAEATSRVRRGGCWTDEGWPCRSAFRLRFEPERRYDHIGFRVVIVKL